MLIAVSGPQGTGKGTILEGMVKQGYNVIQRKTSRSILDDWGLTLDQVNKNHELTIRFQDEITRRKIADEKEAAEGDELVLTERTHADLFVYSLITLGLDNNCSDWINRYFEVCKEHNKYYHHVIYVPSGMFPVTSDGVRGVNKHYSRMADLVMLENTRLMTPENKISFITTIGIEDRVDETIKIIKAII